MLHTLSNSSHVAEVRVVGFEPTLFCSRRRRTTRLSHTLKLKRPATGGRLPRRKSDYRGRPSSELTARRPTLLPALPPWQDSTLPLHHGRSFESLVELSKNELVVRLETRDVSVFMSRCLVFRPQACSLKSQASFSGAEGSRTLTFPLKRRKRYRYATTPNVEWAYAFESCASCQRRVSVLEGLQFSGSPENRTQRHLDISRVWATSPRLPLSLSRDGRNRTDTIVRPRHASLPLPNIPLFCFFHAVTRVGFEPNLFSLKD